MNELVYFDLSRVICPRVILHDLFNAEITIMRNFHKFEDNRSLLNESRIIRVSKPAKTSMGDIVV